MKQLIISVGKRHDPSLVATIDEFTARVSREVEATWQLIKPSGADEQTARHVESQSVLEALRSDDFVVLLDEKGVELSSAALSESYMLWLARPARLVFVIGGAYGVDELLLKRADFVWSLSKLVFPHQLVRVILVEQLYRAHMIAKNHPYHHT